MDSQYTMTVIDHFMAPRNIGSMKEPSGYAVYGDIKCGDSLTLYLKIEDGVIEDVKFLVFGCTAAIATSSMLTEMVKGLSIEEARKITEKDLTDALGGLPTNKLHCSVLGVKTLNEAIDNYEDNKS